MESKNWCWKSFWFVGRYKVSKIVGARLSAAPVIDLTSGGSGNSA
jgi:hypothetical protein